MKAISNKTLSKRQTVLVILFVLCLCFIWGNSMIGPELSGQISHFVAFILGGNREPDAEGHHLIRKLAHFSEFCALGVITSCLVSSFTSDKYRRILTVMFVGIFVPLTDETIQMFTSRGPAITDVWIDIGGFTFGCVASVAVALIAYRGVRGKCRKE